MRRLGAHSVNTLPDSIECSTDTALAFYEDHGYDDGEPALSKNHTGNFIRNVQIPIVRAPVANMTPRKSVYEFPDVDEEPAPSMKRSNKVIDVPTNRPAVASESDSSSRDYSSQTGQSSRHSSESRDSEETVPNNQANGNEDDMMDMVEESDAEAGEMADGE